MAEQTKVILSRPKDRSLEAYKAWIRESVLLAFQITSYDKERVIGVIGYLEPNYMRQLEQILRNMMRL